MPIYKKLKSFISLVCIVALLLCSFTISVGAADGKTVTASTTASIKQGSSGTCYVYIDSTTDLAALDVTVHFDPEKVKINSIYNSISCLLYDSAKNTDNIQFNYILDGEGTNSQTRLFYFYYQVLPNAETGDAYFHITIGEAYDSGLNDVAVSGSRCDFVITENITNKTCTVSSSSTVNTAVEQEFSLSYRFSTNGIASGTVVINYDHELFEVVEVTPGGFLNNKITDINTDLLGSVYISFVGTEYNTKYDFVTLKFKTLKNVNEASTITFKASELCDKELNVISCKEYTTTANIVFDDSYVENAPKMSVMAEYNAQTKKVTANILLEAGSHLGAGDFTLDFDPKLLSFESYEKKFSPTFFNVNDKEIADGKLKFSVISLEDITTAETVLTVTFDIKSFDTKQQTQIIIDGNMLTDSLVNPIVLNFVNDSITMPANPTSSYIVRKGKTLEYKDMIYVKVVFDLVDIDVNDVDISKDAGLLCWTREEFEALDTVNFDSSHALVGLAPYPGSNYYYGKSDGFYTRYLADEYYYVGYVKMPDGSYEFSEPLLYGPKTYAYNMLEKSTTKQETKQLCIALLNYIAAAQQYFYEDISQDALANSGLTAEQKKMEWSNDPTLFNIAATVPDDKTVPVDKIVFKKTGKNLRFKEMISLISVYNIDDSIVENAKESGTVFWTTDEFDALVGTPSLDNIGKGKKVPLKVYDSDNTWCSVAPAVAAKDMADTSYYILGYVVHQDGSISYSGVMSYSFEQYIYNKVTGSDTSAKMLEFAKRLYIYERTAALALKQGEN